MTTRELGNALPTFIPPSNTDASSGLQEGLWPAKSTAPGSALTAEGQPVMLMTEQRACQAKHQFKMEKNLIPNLSVYGIISIPSFRNKFLWHLTWNLFSKG